MSVCGVSCAGGNHAGASAPQIRSRNPITIEVLPVNDVIYKIPGDLDFESWTLDISVKGVDPAHAPTRLEIHHYSGEAMVYSIKYPADSLPGLLENQEETVFRNLHFMLPARLSADRLEIDLFSGNTLLGRRSMPLMRYKQQNRYRLPVSGTWFVSSGHDFGVEHLRHMSRGHFAWDFVRTNENGQTSKGPRLEDNFSFGQPVYAAAEGVVVDLQDGHPDNPPGVVGKRDAANFVVINHGNGEFSRALHLKNGSIRVSIGDRVVSGQLIGQAGNSGASDAPHLHFHFEQHIPDGKGGTKQIPIPVLFSDYKVSWNQGTDLLIENGRPRRGQFVCQSP